MASDQAKHQQVLDSTAATEGKMRRQRVAGDVYETTGPLVILAPLPAVTPDDVTIELRPGALRFWANLRSAGPREYIAHEWEYGGYDREVALPDGYGSGVEAGLANGQLSVRVLRGPHAGNITVKPVSL